MINKASSAPKVKDTDAPTKPIKKTPPAEEPQPLQNTANIEAEPANKGINPAIIVLIVILSAALLAGLIFGIRALFRGNQPYHIEEYQGEAYYIIDKDYDGEYDLQYRLFDDDDLYTYAYEPEYNDEETEEEEIEEPQYKDCDTYPEGEERDKCVALILDDDDDDDDYDDYDDYDDDNDYYEYPDVAEVVDYETYEEYCDRWGYNQKYTDPTKQYALFSYISYGSPTIQARLSHVSFENGAIVLYIWDDANGVTADNAGYLIVVPFDDKEVISLATVNLYTQEEFNQIKNGEIIYYPVVDKPIVYLYPQEETEVSVKLGQSDLLTVSYPKYFDGWNVIAKPDGTLIDLDTNRELYSLYYESRAIEKPELAEGFVVKGEDSAKFLEEKLEILGLTEREAEEFIVYWLPKLETNKYNLIRFETAAEIAKNMPLDISPAPDTVIRVIMDFKALDEEIKIKEQVLETPTRAGFTVVEWGGSELE